MTGWPEPQPEIEAGPVTLRPWRAEDVSFVFHACQDPDIQRFTTVPVPYRAMDAVAFVRRVAEGYRAGDLHGFAITDTESGEVLGAISLHHVDHAASRALLGYWAGPDARGRGAMRPAVEAVTRYAFAALGLATVQAWAMESNGASRALVERAGYAEASRTTLVHRGDMVSMVVYERRATDPVAPTG